MRGVGMDTSCIQHDASHATGVVQVALKDGQPQFDIVNDCAYDHLEPVSAPVDDTAMIYHGTLALRHDTSRYALDQLIERLSAPIFMDVNLRAPWWRRNLVSALLDRASWVKLNDTELAMLSENGHDDHSRAMALLERHRLERVIITLGDRGAFTIDTDGAVLHAHPHPTDTIVDTVGAGDAFSAVCIYGILNHWLWSTIMQRSIEFASQLVAQRGAIITDPEAYRTLKDSWRQSNIA
jgi:fructokinase